MLGHVDGPVPRNGGGAEDVRPHVAEQREAEGRLQIVRVGDGPSRASLTSAMPMPSSRPSRAAKPASRSGLGEVGLAGGTAWLLIRMGPVAASAGTGPLPDWSSREPRFGETELLIAITRTVAAATALAIRAAPSAVPAFASMLTALISFSAVAVTSDWSCCGVRSPSSARLAAASTAGSVTTTAASLPAEPCVDWDEAWALGRVEVGAHADGGCRLVDRRPCDGEEDGGRDRRQSRADHQPATGLDCPQVVPQASGLGRSLHGTWPRAAREYQRPVCGDQPPSWDCALG